MAGRQLAIRNLSALASSLVWRVLDTIPACQRDQPTERTFCGRGLPARSRTSCCTPQQDFSGWAGNGELVVVQEYRTRHRESTPPMRHGRWRYRRISPNERNPSLDSSLWWYVPVEARWSCGVLLAFGLDTRELSTGDSPPEAASRSPRPTPRLPPWRQSRQPGAPPGCRPGCIGAGLSRCRVRRRDSRGGHLWSVAPTAGWRGAPMEAGRYDL
jgi:hypothetical protein